jgi:hypothetical protein
MPNWGLLIAYAAALAAAQKKGRDERPLEYSQILIEWFWR